jgi:hypothetical protein
MLLKVDFVYSFNQGADTFFGNTVVNFSAPDMDGVQTTTATGTINGGTGMFEGATGFDTGSAKVSPPPPGESVPITTSSGGEITAPRLTAVPEPATSALFSTACVGLAGLAAMCKRRRTCI